jgi:hypothetical protein
VAGLVPGVCWRCGARCFSVVRAPKLTCAVCIKELAHIRRLENRARVDAAWTQGREFAVWGMKVK